MTVQVQFETFMEEDCFKIPFDPIFVPQDATSLDLSVFINDLCKTNQQFDFIIEEAFLEDTLGVLLTENPNINSEQIIKVLFQLAIQPPQFQQMENVDDWVADFVRVNQNFYVACYDGSIQIVRFENNQLHRQSIVKVSKQPLTKIIQFGNFIITGGYEGTILIGQINEQESFKLLFEFSQNQNFVPILDLVIFMRNEIPVVIALTEGGIVAIDFVAELQKDNYTTDQKIKKDILRGTKCDSIVFKHDFQNYRVLNICQYSESELLLGCSDNQVKLFNIDDLKVIKQYYCSAVPTCIKVLEENEFVAGFQDRSIRKFDVTTGKIIKSYIQHTTAISQLSVISATRFASVDITGKCFVWECHSPKPYHKIDFYDSEMDRRNDQNRILALSWESDGIFAGGSSRKLIWFTI